MIKCTKKKYDVLVFQSGNTAKMPTIDERYYFSLQFSVVAVLYV